MEGGVIELAMQAAAAARAEREARGDGAARRPVPRYRGVTRRGHMYVAEIMDAAGLRPVFLGSYATAEEAAHAYAAAARIMNGNNAEPNVPEPPLAPAPVAVAVAVGGGGRRVGVLPLVGHARVRRAPPQDYGQQPAPRRQALAAPVGHARMRTPLHNQQPAPPQAFSAQQGPGPIQNREHASVTAIVGDNFTKEM